MSEQLYNIVFRGDIVFGHQLNDVKLRLQQLFKTDEAKINALFTGKPVVLKRNLDQASAEKYRVALLNTGAQVTVVVADESSVVSAPVVQRASQSAPAPVQSSVNKPVENLSLAPVGINLLEADQQKQFIPRNVDTSSLQIRPLGGNLVDSAEQKIAVAPVNVPNFEVAIAGTNLVSPDEKLAIPIVEIDVSDWDIAEAGADLINEDEKEIVLPAIVNTLDVGLAPVGADLGQLKPQIKPVAPDISGLRLAD